MKMLRIKICLFSLAFAFACNHQPGIKTIDDTTAIEIPKSEKIITIENNKGKCNDVNAYEELITEIVTTSPRYQQLTKGLQKAVVKNGGISFGLSMERSPNKTQDKSWIYSHTYDFTLYETYPERQLNTARFSFNPNNKQLYEYDEVHDQMKAIEFDSSLLKKFE